MSEDADDGAVVPCPVCDRPSHQNYPLPASFMKDELSRYYEEELPPNLPISDYFMYRCPRCTLEFAWPLEEGNSGFYDWITRHRTYYPDERWEWAEVKKWLAAQSRPLNLLEIGSGSGAFLESLRDLEHVTAIGLDPTVGSAETCRAKGLAVYAETLAGYADNPTHAIRGFDVIVAFHCLEHIADPKGLVADMLKLLTPAGRLFLSTPYSPMSFEGPWFDPLNHPPHHMTRWNASAYAALARQFGLQLQLHLPKADRTINRVAWAFNFSLNGPQHLQNRNQILLRAMKKPRAFLAEVTRQIRRERVNGKTAPDVVLAIFSRPPAEVAG